jgi:uncharacterized protein
MNYRSFPESDENLSILGFGCMRLPLLSDSPADIDIEQSKAMVRSAIDRGVNYIDTAYPYHGGKSEGFVAEVLQDGYRQRVKLATKLPCWLVNCREDMDRLLNEQLDRLATDHIDYYLLHALNKSSWEKMLSFGVIDFMDAAVADGRVIHMGFSFHDDLDTFKTIIDAYDWDFCQIQYNFLDTHVQAGTEGLSYAYDRGIGIIVMEPLRGGSLTSTLPNDIAQIWSNTSVQRTPAAWALRWVWDDPRVTVVLSGMSDQLQVDENITIAQQAAPHSLTSDEHASIAQVKELYLQKIAVPCTACGYCMPCPHGVNIPEAFRFYNDAMMFETIEQQKDAYRRNFADHMAERCIACGECEPQCPQQIPIIKALSEVSRLFC